MNQPRETLLEALLAQLAKTVVGDPPQPAFVTLDRKYRHWDNVADGEQPAGFLTSPAEHAGQSQSYGETKWRLRATLWLYIKHSPDSGVNPGAVLNLYLDAIEAALLPQFAGDKQTLGGLVANCYIDGETLKSEGSLPDDVQSLALIPILIETGV